ncbi:MAG: cysteine synthase A [Rikenellaceae bacterium]|nr:cysteine synthase A [Rikenellaceae bacterium]
MTQITRSITDLIGQTPLVEIPRYAADAQAAARMLVKVESFNPGGSVKDRIAQAMVRDAEERRILRPGATIIEPTSGNTGIGLAMVAAAHGYRLILTMPETMSVERRSIVRAYGGQIVLTPGAEGMKGAIARAEALRDEIEGSVILGQFTNPANPAVHKRTTGPEIWKQSGGEVDIFVAGVGTGGTVSGVGAALKERKPDIQVVAVEPADSPVLSGGKPGPHKIQGIGAGFIPQNYNPEVVDLVMQVASDDAIRTARQLGRTEGILAGISSGAALRAATELARRPENAGKVIVALLPDGGERYLSTALFDFENYPLE